MKDPAFLFYSNDYYSGTRIMTPLERSCFIDLLCFQHQNGYVIDNLDRLLLFCSGHTKATLEATLEAKFKKTAKGWINERLETTTQERESYKTQASINGQVGQFYKKSKKLLSMLEYNDLRRKLARFSNEEIIIILENNKINIKNMALATLKGLLKHIEDVNENENINTFEDKESVRGKETFNPLEKLKSNEIEFQNLEYKFSEIKDFNELLESCSNKIESEESTMKVWTEWSYKILWNRFQKYLTNTKINQKTKIKKIDDHNELVRKGIEATRNGTSKYQSHIL